MGTENEIHEARIEVTQKLLKESFLLANELSIRSEKQINFVDHDSLIMLNERISFDMNLILRDEVLSRLVLLLGIKTDLEKLSTKREAVRFYRTENNVLGGSSPLEVIFKDSEVGLLRVEKMNMRMTMQKDLGRCLSHD